MAKNKDDFSPSFQILCNLHCPLTLFKIFNHFSHILPLYRELEVLIISLQNMIEDQGNQMTYIIFHIQKLVVTPHLTCYIIIKYVMNKGNINCFYSLWTNEPFSTEFKVYVLLMVQKSMTNSFSIKL